MLTHSCIQIFIQIILLLIFRRFSRPPPLSAHKSGHCSRQNFNLLEIGSRCGFAAVSSRGAAGPLVSAGACSSCRTFENPCHPTFRRFILSDSFAASAHLVHQPQNHSPPSLPRSLCVFSGRALEDRNNTYCSLLDCQFHFKRNGGIQEK